MELNAINVTILGAAAFLSGIGTIYGFLRAMFRRRWDQHVRLTLLEHMAHDKTDWDKLRADLLK